MISAGSFSISNHVQAQTIEISDAKIFQNLDASNLSSFKNEASSIVLIKANWCSTCMSQIKTLTALKKDAHYQNIKFFIVDYDRQKNILKSMHVTTQSTIIASKKGVEVSRLIAQDDLDQLKNLLDKSL